MFFNIPSFYDLLSAGYFQSQIYLPIYIKTTAHYLPDPLNIQMIIKIRSTGQI